MMQALSENLERPIRTWHGHPMRLSFLVVLAISVTACSSGLGSSGAPDGGGGTAGSEHPYDGGLNDGAEAGQRGSAGDSSVTSSDVCKSYVACIAETTPAGLDAILAAYGEGGSC